MIADLAVTTDGLTKRFDELTAVDSVDLEVESGTVVSLLGPNGAGKTTIVRMLATLSEPSGGRAAVCGHDVVREADAVRGLISLTGQFAALEDNLTARENLMLMARLRGYGKSGAARVVDGLVDRFDIGEQRDKLIKTLSGGQRRRVDLAASLVTQPRLLVLDEPTTGLDPRSRQVVWSTVRDLVAEGVTVLLTTQYLEEADALAERVVLIDHGRAVAAGTPSELKARIGDQRVDVVAVDGQGFDQLVAALAERFELTVSRERRMVSIPAPGEVDDLRAVATVVGASGVAVDEVALRRPTLDDAFLALTGQPATDPAADGSAGDGTATAGSAGDGTATAGSAGDGTAGDGSAAAGTAGDGIAGAGTAGGGTRPEVGP
jgi:ABC-2 type transport system ATP-binding protein